MIEPSSGRADLEYRYHIVIETDALLDSAQHGHYSNGPDCNYLGDPAFESEVPDLKWVRVEGMSCARATVREAGRWIWEMFGKTIKCGSWWYHIGQAIHVEGEVLLRSCASVRHEAAVPCSEWCDEAEEEK